MYNVSEQLRRQMTAVQSSPEHEKRQEECHIIVLRNTTPREKVFIPQLQKFFKEYGHDKDEVSIQLKSFQFSNDFPNVFKTDAIALWTSVVYKNRDTQVRHQCTRSVQNNPFKIKVSNGNTQTCTAQELVDQLNHNLYTSILQHFEWEIAQGIDGDTHQDNYSNIRNSINVLNHCKFEYDISSGKLVLVFSKTDKPAVLFAVNDDGDVLVQRTNDYDIDDISILVTTDRTTPNKDQQRVSQCLGMQPVEVLGQMGVYGQELWDDAADLIISPAVQDQYKDLVNVTGQLRLKFSHRMDVFWVKLIQVNTSTRTNTTFGDGRIQPILDVIPVTTSQMHATQIHERDQKIYRIKETLTGIRKMDIHLVDERGDELAFLVPYEMQIAVFLK